MNFRYQFLKKLSPLIIIASLILLLLVPIIGLEDKGATRWISIGGFTLQPSEFVKLGVIIYLASVYSKKHKYINRFIQGVLPPLVIVVFLFTLILLQPDLGTAVVILMVTGIIIFFVRCKTSALNYARCAFFNLGRYSNYARRVSNEPDLCFCRSVCSSRYTRTPVDSIVLCDC
ncbi:FtsW/RodA/SpoVE family cell cycle protein [Geomicrobium sp. JCM 19055]|uniref:FtsW/RodA/SpoVE family cell cycle protein n=1 Tax=Geomicrobium sp. JCM 19055 TaxID=1460649 RepID=UPI00351C7240